MMGPDEGLMSCSTEVKLKANWPRCLQAEPSYQRERSLKAFTLRYEIWHRLLFANPATCEALLQSTRCRQ
jgi:hypothetical protein